MADALDDVYNEYVIEFSNQEDARSYGSNGSYVPDYDKADLKAKELTFLSYYTGKKQDVNDWFTQDEWYQYEAPTWNQISTASDTDDALTVFTRDSLKNLGNNFTLNSIDKIVNDAGASKLLDSEEARTSYRQTLKDIYYEKKNAEQKYSRQWSKYGLPDPSLRYGLVADPANKVVVYDKGIQYVDNASAQFYTNLQKKGISKERAAVLAEEFNKQLTTQLDAKLRASQVTPFIVAASRKKG